MSEFTVRIVRSIDAAIRNKAWPFLMGFAFALLCFVALNAAMVPISRSEYCGAACHEMNDAYLNWELSSHGSNARGIRVECIDCHLPSKDKYFTHVAAKGYAGLKDTYKHYFGGEYDSRKMRELVRDRISSARCLNCHDNLLAKAGSSAARSAHTAALAKPHAPENRCVQCHEDVGHQRQSRLFSQ